MAPRHDSKPHLDSPAPNPENRRRHGRIHVEGLLCSWGRVLDHSGGGLRIQMTLRCPTEGQLIHATIPTPKGELSVAARVAWTKRVGLLTFQAGCEFVALDADSQRLLMETASATATSARRVA